MMRFESSGRLFVDDDFVGETDFSVVVFDDVAGANFYFADTVRLPDDDRHVIEIEWHHVRYRLLITKHDVARGLYHGAWPHEGQIEDSQDRWKYLREDHD